MVQLLDQNEGNGGSEKMLDSWSFLKNNGLCRGKNCGRGNIVYQEKQTSFSCEQPKEEFTLMEVKRVEINRFGETRRGLC